jgi:hypothetical protein
MSDAATHFKGLRDRYRSTFCGADGDLHPAGKAVIANLRELTKYGSSPFSTDAGRMAYTVGMQDVFLHIQQMLNISDADIYRLTRTPPQQEEGLFGNDF